MVAIPDPERKVEVEKVVAIIVIVIIVMFVNILECF